MKRVHIAAPVLGLALIIIGGCRQAVAPAFSPDGKTLAYVKGHRLVIDSAGREEVFGVEDPTDMAWSPDGDYLAWSSGGGDYLEEGNGKGAIAKRVARPETTWILDIARRHKAKAVGIGRPLGWLNGDLVGVDIRNGKRQLATLDPSSGQIRSEVPLPGRVPSQMSPATSDRVLYLNNRGKTRGWSAFDGLNFAPMKDARQLLAVKLGAGETAFLAIPVNLPQRELKLYQWAGNRMSQSVLFDLPARGSKGKGKGVTIMAIEVAASAHLEVVAAAVMLMRGSQDQEQGLLRFMKQHPLPAFDSLGKVPKKVDAELRRLTKKMKMSEVVYVWRTDGERRLITQWDDDNQFRSIAVDSGGRRLAMGSDAGIRMVSLDNL